MGWYTEVIRFPDYLGGVSREVSFSNYTSFRERQLVGEATSKLEKWFTCWMLITNDGITSQNKALATLGFCLIEIDFSLCSMQFCTRADYILWANEKGHETYSLIYCFSCCLHWKVQWILLSCNAEPFQVVNLVSFQFECFLWTGSDFFQKPSWRMLKGWLALQLTLLFLNALLSPKFKGQTFYFLSNRNNWLWSPCFKGNISSLIT